MADAIVANALALLRVRMCAFRITRNPSDELIIPTKQPGP